LVLQSSGSDGQATDYLIAPSLDVRSSLQIRQWVAEGEEPGVEWPVSSRLVEEVGVLEPAISGHLSIPRGLSR